VRRGPGRGLHIGQELASADYSTGTNEPAVQDAIVGHLRPGDTFLDVGANVGFFSLLAARVVGPAGTVVAMEAVPDVARCVEANAHRNSLSNIRVLPVAAGARSGTAQLALARHPGGAVLASAGTPPDATRTIDVPVVAIDDLVRRADIPPPNVVKIDVEGAEDSVLDGLGETLTTTRPTLVIELDDASAQGLERRADDLVRRLRALDYRVDRLPAAYSGGSWNVAHYVADPRASGSDTAATLT
jgi:FkbM family methyltransferase